MREVTGKETTEKGGGKVNKKMIVESNRGKEKEKKKRESREDGVFEKVREKQAGEGEEEGGILRKQ